MEPLTISLDITPADLAVVKTYLKDKHQPVVFNDLAFQVAIFKTQDKRSLQVKVYDPGCEYKVGDLLFKEYPGSLPVGSKKTIELPEGVILKVEETRSLPGMNAIRLSYEGTSEFRHYTEYLKKQKIELLLPHKLQKPPAEPRYMTSDVDPRTQEAPLIERDLKELKRKLTTALNRETDIAFICDRVLMRDNLRPIPPEVFDSIKEFLKGHGQSESTEFFAENFAKVDPKSADFDSTCFALNFLMTHQHKVYLCQTMNRGWGRWHLNSVLTQLKKNALVSEPNPLLSHGLPGHDRQALAAQRREFEQELFSEGENRYFLTLREIASGALRLRPGAFHFGEAIEVEAEDTGTRKSHTFYYYPEENLLLGFGKIYETYKVIQGTILTFEQTAEGAFQFSIKTSKKGTIADRIVWDAEKRLFIAQEEKISSPVFANKAIYLESEVLHSLAQRMEEFRKIDTCNKLVQKVFLDFGAREKNFEMSILRLYHILDLIYPVDLRTVEEIVLVSPEFIPSEKIPGTIYLDADAVVEIEEEERQRRSLLIEESKRKREELRKQQVEEEQRQKDEIRLLREERRKKREEEMFQHEQAVKPADATREFAPVELPDRPGRVEPRAEPAPPRGEPVKKPRKKLEIVEKPVKTVKKGAKKILEEKIELDEIKKQLTEDITETRDELEERLKREAAEKEVTVAYQDEGGFGGIFANLDEIVKKDEDTEEPRGNKKKKKK
jgi:hypothetical protein